MYTPAAVWGLGGDVATENLMRDAAAPAAARKRDVMLEIRRPDGRRAAFPAWRSRYDLGAQPAVGTIRFTEAPDRDSGQRLALEAALQCAAFRLPYGGASGGVALPPDLDPAVRDHIRAAFARAFPDMVLTPHGGCGFGSGTILAGWLDLDGRDLCPKPHPRIAGLSREDAIALCAVAAVTRLHEQAGRCVLVGCDRPALHMARLLHAAGWRLVGACDGAVAVANARGLAPSELACAMAGGSLAALVGERGTQRVPVAHHAAAELVVVAGRDLVLNLDGTATVVELAPRSLTPEAETFLVTSGVRVVPDIVACAGAAILAHLRSLQRRHRIDWTRAEMQRRLLKRFNEGLSAIDDGGDLRQATVVNALRFMDSLGSGRVHSL